MKLHSNLTLRPDFLYLAPLLNVVMLLLIFFLLNSNFVVRSGIRVDVPVSASSLKPMERAHSITITAGDPPQVFLGERELPVSDLKTALEALQNESRHVIISADKTTSVGLLQDVQNAAIAAGCEIAIATKIAP
ncbi:MAG: biopolymer transporter ExbD [Verrucomicrobiota bacterium]